MPRDPERIDRMLALLREIWTKYPDLRLGQIISSAASLGHAPAITMKTDVFYTEDGMVERGLEVLHRLNLGTGSQVDDGAPLEAE